MKTLLLVGAIAILLTSAKATQNSDADRANGLRMSLAHDDTASGSDQAMHFTVTFSNVTQHEISFPAGMLDCIKPPSKTSDIKLNLTDPSGNPHRHLPYWGDGPPYAGAVACGNMHPFVAVLGPGKSLSLPLDLGKYFDLADSKQFVGATFPAGKYSMDAELTYMPPESAVLPIGNWTGTVSSNTVEVFFESEFAAPLSDGPE
jgi:hypothetical protein